VLRKCRAPTKFWRCIFYFVLIHNPTFSKDVDIPESLQNQLRDSIEGVTRAVAKYDPHFHVLSSQIESVRASEKDEDPLFAVFREWISKVKPKFPAIDVRVKNGSYTVTQTVEDIDDSRPEGQPRRAKQKIRTVQTESPLFKLLNGIFRLLTTGRCGDATHKETKVIMEGVNLALDPGKLYLVLGAPGSGE
jgi:hypothetical protein